MPADICDSKCGRSSSIYGRSIDIVETGVEDMRVYRHWRSPSVLGIRRCHGAPFAQAHNPHFQRCSSSAQLHIPPPSQSIMSQTPATTAASNSSPFQAIFQAAIKSYQKQTKNDLLAHPLASRLQDCDSTNAIIAILQDQVREFDQSRSGDERLTKWLGPTVNVLNAFSATISGGVSLVSLDS